MDKCGQNNFYLFLKNTLYKTWLLLSLPPEHTHIFLTQFYNVKWVKKNPP